MRSSGRGDSASCIVFKDLMVYSSKCFILSVVLLLNVSENSFDRKSYLGPRLEWQA